ncbi:hypothetical protein [Microbulbifer hainanensis]|uniref:hypothetical protein n=1 Tax=Microbulbifer hainanensis TaxID=2735675 RepID=UPI001867E383|nr:hypothetical protein [Microbulbifer hainanensis]
MSKKEEVKVLESVLRKFTNSHQPMIQKWWFQIVLWIVFSSFIAVGIALYKNNYISDFVYMIWVMISGAAVGFATLLRVSARQWPMLLPHISKVSIESRLKELNT